MFKKIFLIAMSLVSTIVFCSFFTSANGEICARHNGSNINCQSYENNSSPILSYITVTDSKEIMRFQYSSSGEYMLVQYFSEDYVLKSSTVLAAELPIFGGFCETESFYFIITGQENSGGSSNKEVFRITKYDKNWKRCAYLSIKGTYTSVPFYNGTVRFAVSSDYLLIRTSHKMYKSAYSSECQANITFQLNIEEMEITAQMTGFSNLNYGKAENSFDQYISLDENDVTVAVDFISTEAVNSIKLFNYNNSASDGDFSASHLYLCTCADMFTQAEDTENSICSVGGFEITDTDYIVAGVAKSESGTDNIFVSAISRENFSSSSVACINYLTDYTNSEDAVSTPHLVKISSGRFVVLWTCGEKLFYTEIDSGGKAVGETHSFAGNLSDCVPVINGDKIIWYTWENDEIIFYEISTEDLSQNKIVVPKIHSFTNYISDGNAECDSDGTKTAECDNCGKTDTVTDTGSAKGHDMSQWQQTVSPTCTTEGEQQRYCSRCDHYESEALPLLPHSEVIIPAVSASCTKTGLTEGKQCSVCKTVTTAQETVAMTPHTLTTLKAVEATCTKTGLTEGKKCSVCGTVTVTQKEVTKLAHTYTTATTKATLSKNGKAENKCSVCGYIKSTTTIYYPKTIKLSATEYTYNGKVKTPTVTVKDSKGSLLAESADYTVKNESGRKLPGKYTVTITFNGNYSGTKKLTFTILPKSTSKITATQTTTSITLKWSKVKGATGYRVYKYNSETKKYEKITGTTSTSFKVKDLKAGTTYKFKIKAYSKVDGTTLWGNASAVFETATKPKTPTLKITSTSKTKATLTWTNVSGESGYQVYYSTSKDGEFKKLKSYKADTKKATKSDLKSGKTYYFKVRAYKKTDSGTVYSSWSSVKSVKIK